MNTLKQNISDLQQVLGHIEIDDLITKTEKQFTREVVDLSRKSVKPDSPAGQIMIDNCNLLRRLGTKILNLLKIEFTVTFAGATLIHWQIPKIDSDSLTVKTNKK